MAKVRIERDPRALTLRLPERDEKKRVLGLDLATTTGYTFVHHRVGDPVELAHLELFAGQLDLAALAYDSGAIRFVRLRQFLAVLDPDLVVYESVKNNPPDINKANARAVLSRVATAAELLGAFKATVCTWCEERDVPCTGFSIQAIKKRATGRGNANKENMIRSTNETFGLGLEVENYELTGTDNIADSVWVCVLGLEQYGNGLASGSGPENSNSGDTDD